MQLGNQVSVGGIGRRVRQGDAGQRVKVAQTAAGQLQAQIQGAEVEGICQRAGQFDAGVGNGDLGLERERSR
ncbi:hypothetical protein D3C73_773920 [compost metagenome]